MENQVLDKWSEDFGSLYSGVPNDDPNYDNDFLTQVTSKRIFKGFNEYDTETLNKPITRQEVKQAEKESKNGKAVSIDRLPNEIFKNDTSIEVLYELFNYSFNNALVPDMWRKSLITPVFKGKGKDPKNPLSYRPISLICNSGKIFTNILNK